MLVDPGHEYPDEQWAAAWGGAQAQWFATILPRLHPYLPAATVLEIGGGYGRLTANLRRSCARVIVASPSEDKTTLGQERFADDPTVTVVLDPGLGLKGIDDGSIDLAATFDALVHAETAQVTGVLQGLARCLGPDGVAFVHHSNVAGLDDAIRGTTPLHGRAADVSGQWLIDACAALGLSCISQERIGWGGPALIDAFSVITRAGSAWDRPLVIVDNPGFMAEATSAAAIARLYSRERPATRPSRAPQPVEASPEPRPETPAPPAATPEYAPEPEPAPEPPRTRQDPNDFPLWAGALVNGYGVMFNGPGMLEADAALAEVTSVRDRVMSTVGPGFARLEHMARERVANLQRYAGVNVLSVGLDCLPRSLSGRWGLKRSAGMGEGSGPFDLAVHPPTSVAKLLANGFDGYLDPEALSPWADPPIVANTRYGIWFNHEIGPRYVADDFTLLREVYTRRIARFMATIDDPRPLLLLAHRPHYEPLDSADVDAWRAVLATVQERRTGPTLMLALNTHLPEQAPPQPDADEEHFTFRSLPVPSPEYAWHIPAQYLTDGGWALELRIVELIRKQLDRLAT